MKLIAITSPGYIPGEEQRAIELLEKGFWRIHLRKPEAELTECCQWLDRIPYNYRQRIVIHQHSDLYQRYGLAGIHLNSRLKQWPSHYKGSRSCSCHSLQEVAECKPQMDYVLLSPIFDSISKQGYKAAFTSEQLEEAAQNGLIDHRVVALGGVTLQRLPLLEHWHFGGAAMLGALWATDDKS